MVFAAVEVAKVVTLVETDLTELLELTIVETLVLRLLVELLELDVDVTGLSNGPLK